MIRFVMRYKRPPRPVETGEIEASTVEKARELGKEWCERNQARYISVEDPVLVREESGPVNGKAGSVAAPAPASEEKRPGILSRLSG